MATQGAAAAAALYPDAVHNTAAEACKRELHSCILKHKLLLLGASWHLYIHNLAVPHGYLQPSMHLDVLDLRMRHQSKHSNRLKPHAVTFMQKAQYTTAYLLARLVLYHGLILLQQQRLP